MNDELIAEFKIEAEEMFEAAEEGFLNIEKGESFLENFNRIFRAFHSLKGAAGMFGLQDLQSHMHKLESLFEAQKAEGEMGKAQIDYFLRGVDAAKLILDGNAVDFDHQTEDQLKGQTISVRAEEVVAKPLQREEKIKKPQRGLIYIVDDEPEILELLKEMIETLDFEVHTFNAACDLLNNIEHDTPDIILSDISMPNMNGVEMVKEIRQKNQSVSVIMISGRLSKETILELLKYDVSGFIEKPFEQSELSATVERAFRASQLSSLLSKSINYMLYQFSDLDSYLKQAGKENLRVSLKEELKNIMKVQNELNEHKKRIK